MSSNLFVLLFLLQSFKGIFAGTVSSFKSRHFSLIFSNRRRGVCRLRRLLHQGRRQKRSRYPSQRDERFRRRKRLQRRFPSRARAPCMHLPVETKNAVHLTPRCLLGPPSRPTLPALAFKRSSLVVGMGHSIESQLNVARAIAARYDWRRLELWTEDVDGW